MSSLIEQYKKLKAASRELGSAETHLKNTALESVARSLKKNEGIIIEANGKDVKNACDSGMQESLIDRLKLDSGRIVDMINGINTIIELRDPVWKSSEVWTLPNGLTISKMTVPLGVIGIIYESRPNVTIDAFALALKSGNAILLRGSSSAIHSNRALVAAVKEGLAKSALSPDLIGFVDDTDRAAVMEMMGLKDYLDLIIPRGGAGLIDFVTDNSRVPTIETGVGNCHIFVDESADLEEAVNIVENAKVQRPGVCNACETVLVHKHIADVFLPILKGRLGDRVELRGCEETRKIIDAIPAVEKDWKEEYLDYILAVKVTGSLDEAVEHITKYGTKHSEAILTQNLNNAKRFQRVIDAAAVYVNASTRFTDGGQFGFGAEMGISTQKVHARGPMGLNELVTVKYTIMGSGQVRH